MIEGTFPRHKAQLPQMTCMTLDQAHRRRAPGLRQKEGGWALRRGMALPTPAPRPRPLAHLGDAAWPAGCRQKWTFPSLPLGKRLEPGMFTSIERNYVAFQPELSATAARRLATCLDLLLDRACALSPGTKALPLLRPGGPSPLVLLPARRPGGQTSCREG